MVLRHCFYSAVNCVFAVQGMLQVPNPTEYKGLVIAKRRADAPVTDEPIVYAYARIVPERRPVIASEVVLGLAENKDRANRFVLQYTI